MIDSKTVLGIILLICLFLISLPFESHYSSQFQMWAQNPAARFGAGIGFIALSTVDPILGGLAFLILFLWIADIQLLSSINLS